MTSIRPSLAVGQKSTLRRKFVRTMLLVSSITGITTLGFVALSSARVSADHLNVIQQNIEEGIKSKGKVLTENHALALRGMIADNAFLDMQTLLGRAIKEDPDLVYGLFVNSDGESLAFSSSAARDAEASPPAKDAWRALGFKPDELVTKVEVVHRAERLGQEVVEVAVPVFGEEHEALGTLRYGLSTRRMHQAIEQAQQQSSRQLWRTVELLGGIVGFATLLGIMLSRVQAVRITRPVQALTQAAQDLAAGKRSVQVNIQSGDELEVLGASFDRMVQELTTSYARLEEMNRTLEQKVEERTLELATRNRDMRLVLDNVDQGFVTLSADGTMARERSAVVDAWFGPVGARQPFWEYLSPSAPSFAVGFEIGWEQLCQDFLPLEVALDQLPVRLTRDGRTFSFRYLPILKQEQLEGVLVVIADITDKLLREREEAELTELMQGFRRMMLDRSGFSAFLKEASGMVDAIAKHRPEDELGSLRRTLHTLKGNAGQMGLTVVARLCHLLEEELETGDGMNPATLNELTNRWAAVTDHVAKLIGDSGQHTIEIPDSEYAALVSLLSRDDQSQALHRVLSWQLEPASRMLGRLAEQARTLAKRLGRGDIDTEVQAEGVRLDPEQFAPFFADLAHVVRNAVDHGLQTPEDRRKQGKRGPGRLILKAEVRDKQLVFEITDDGCGIDWQAIRERGDALKLPTRTPAELLNVLCQEGVTTRTQVSEVSGRGVGMAAIKHRIEAMRGRIDVQSSKDVGTKWIIRLPWSPPDLGERLKKIGLAAARGDALRARASGD